MPFVSLIKNRATGTRNIFDIVPEVGKRPELKVSGQPSPRQRSNVRVDVQVSDALLKNICWCIGNSNLACIHRERIHGYPDPLLSVSGHGTLELHVVRDAIESLNQGTVICIVIHRRGEIRTFGNIQFIDKVVAIRISLKRPGKRVVRGARRRARSCTGASAR